MNEPKVSILVALSAFNSGVPVKPMNIASGNSSFMAVCMVPDCVRCASSTKTKMFPLAWKSLGMVAWSSSMNSVVASSSSESVSAARNLCTSEQINHSVLVLRVLIRSAPLVVR
ncbi:Uncharacterised protein [Mycobacteroides abscessus subsp. abscessus]|nr:Uncharacterised protein [Mycobacteroides abscessus subsp. abscessus]